MVDLTTLTIAETSRLMVGKELSPVELTQAALQRISTLNPLLNAFITVSPEKALQEAAPPRGCVPLRGRGFSEITFQRMMRRLPSAWQRRGRFCSVNST